MGEGYGGRATTEAEIWVRIPVCDRVYFVVHRHFDSNE